MSEFISSNFLNSKITHFSSLFFTSISIIKSDEVDQKYVKKIRQARKNYYIVIISNFFINQKKLKDRSSCNDLFVPRYLKYSLFRYYFHFL